MDPDRLLFGLRDVTHAMLERARAAAQADGLGLQSMLSMRHIAAQPGIRPGELAAKLNVTAGSLTPIVQELERRDLIRRDRDPDDGRVQHLSMTPTGTAFRRRIEDHMRQAVGAAFADWDTTSLEVFVGGLERLRSQLTSAP